MRDADKERSGFLHILWVRSRGGPACTQPPGSDSGVGVDRAGEQRWSQATCWKLLCEGTLLSHTAGGSLRSQNPASCRGSREGMGHQTHGRNPGWGGLRGPFPAVSCVVPGHPSFVPGTCPKRAAILHSKHFCCLKKKKQHIKISC